MYRIVAQRVQGDSGLLRFGVGESVGEDTGDDEAETDHTRPRSPRRHETSLGSIQRQKSVGNEATAARHGSAASTGSSFPGAERKHRKAEPRWGESANQWPAKRRVSARESSAVNTDASAALTLSRTRPARYCVAVSISLYIFFSW